MYVNLQTYCSFHFLCLKYCWSTFSLQVGHGSFGQYNKVQSLQRQRDTRGLSPAYIALLTTRLQEVRLVKYIYFNIYFKFRIYKNLGENAGLQCVNYEYFLDREVGDHRKDTKNSSEPLKSYNNSFHSPANTARVHYTVYLLPSQ